MSANSLRLSMLDCWSHARLLICRVVGMRDLDAWPMGLVLTSPRTSTGYTEICASARASIVRSYNVDRYPLGTASGPRRVKGKPPVAQISDLRPGTPDSDHAIPR